MKMKVTHDGVLLTVGDALILSPQSIDFYTHEAIDASHESGFFNAQMSEIIRDIFPILPKVGVTQVFKLLNNDGVLLSSHSHNGDASPSVLLIILVSYLNSMRDEASLVANAFILNVEQRRAFYLITNRTLHRHGLPDQLWMGVFGEAGKGKTHMIKAVQAWFIKLNRSNELLMTATTGTAAINIEDHSATIETIG